MNRRNFICQVTASSATAGISVASAAAAKENRSVVYRVNGFTCVTCAVGVEVMLRGLKGVTRANASYPEKKVAIGFDRDLTSEKTLKEFIAACGFSVA
jgi:copper chaperone CopZ